MKQGAVVNNIMSLKRQIPICNFLIDHHNQTYNAISCSVPLANIFQYCRLKLKVINIVMCKKTWQSVWQMMKVTKMIITKSVYHVFIRVICLACWKFSYKNYYAPKSEILFQYFDNMGLQLSFHTINPLVYNVHSLY